MSSQTIPPQPVKKVSIRISAPGKVILHGEHSVVYDKLALAASLGLRTRLELDETDDVKSGVVSLELTALHLVHVYKLQDVIDFIDRPIPLQKSACNYNVTTPELIDHPYLVESARRFVNDKCGTYPLNLKQEQALTAMFYLFAAILGSFDVKMAPFKLKLASELAVGAGTGSSASYAVTIAAALIQYVKMKNAKTKNGYKGVKMDAADLSEFNKVELELISKWAFNVERIMHGTPSGIDNTICTYGSLVEFRRGSAPKLVALSTKLNFLLINTKVPRDTKTLVQGVARLRDKHRTVIDGILNVMDGLSASALDYINKINRGDGDVDLYRRLSELSKINHDLLRSLEVSHPKLDEACAILARRGLHGKLTGAGGGGYAICLVPPSTKESRVAEVIGELNGKGFETVLIDLGGKGVCVDRF